MIRRPSSAGGMGASPARSRSPIIAKGEPIQHRGGPSGRITGSGSRRSQSPLLKIYLILYNLSSLGAWLFFIIRFTMAWIQVGHDLASLADDALLALGIVQSMAGLEIVHAILRMVPSPVLPTTMQIASRLFVVWTIGYWLKAGDNWGFPLLSIAWTLSDVTRYIYYAVNLSMGAPRKLIWLRYSLFLVLYPAGTIGEMALIHNAMKRLAEEGQWTRWLLLVILIVYPFGFIYMYYHMLKQRRRYLIFTAQ